LRVREITIIFLLPGTFRISTMVITPQQVRAARRQRWWAAERRWRERQPERRDCQRKIITQGAGAADSSERQWRYARREAARTTALVRLRDGTLPRALERTIGPTLDMVRVPPTEAARIAGRPVARIVVMPERRKNPEALATGFLVTPRLLITNHHVLPSKSSAVGLGANFLYDQQNGTTEAGLFFELAPDDFYVSDETLDLALVAINPKAREGNAIEELGAIPLIEATPKILIGQPVNIIQFPEGGVKQWAHTQNVLLDVLDSGFLHYTTDTMRGSSGSPAFNKSWELVALHHAGVPETRNGRIWSTHGTPWDEESMNDDEVNWVANEGARVSAIVGHLGKQRLPRPAQQALLDQLLKTTGDPLSALGSDAAAPVQIPGLPTPINPMANNTFNFSGPVTIYVQSDSVAAISTQLPRTDPALEASIRFDPDYAAKKGYQENFLKIKVPAPTVKANRMKEILTDSDGKPLLLKYRNYSLVMNLHRRLQMWSAVNVDYRSEMRNDKSRKKLGSDRWISDPRIRGLDQIDDPDFYKPATRIDRGHIVRREDSAWGASDEDIEYANSDTFHWTNCTPQHEAFNKESPGKATYGDREGVWGAFEAYVQDQLLADEKRCCILAGPILAKSDPSRDYGKGPIAYPVKFWKVIAVVNGTGSKRKLKTYGFVFNQMDVVTAFGIEFTPGRFARHQKKLSQITELSGVVFDKTLLDADAKKSG
jgi:endonuclease G, mitochondrial